MSRIVLVHWKAAEAAERAASLRHAGHEVRVLSAPDGADLRRLRDDPPDVFVIDFGRMPSHGIAVATFARRQKATRHAALVFVGGQSEKIARARALLPDAVFAEWGRVRSALRRALAQTPEKPVVPGTMDAYAKATLPKKLGIAPGSALMLLGGPADFERTLGRLPAGVRILRQARGRAARVVLFVDSRAELERRFPGAARALDERGGIWIAWPKRASGVPTDLTQAVVRAFGLRSGFVDYKICSIDSTWSGLLFARRRS